MLEGLGDDSGFLSSALSCNTGTWASIFLRSRISPLSFAGLHFLHSGLRRGNCFSDEFPFGFSQV